MRELLSSVTFLLSVFLRIVCGFRKRPTECPLCAGTMKGRQERLWLEAVPSLPRPTSLLSPVPPAAPSFSLQSVSLALAKSSRCLSEQHCAELSSRVISDANACPPAEWELSCCWSQLNRGNCVSLQASSSWGNAGVRGTPSAPPWEAQDPRTGISGQREPQAAITFAPMSPLSVPESRGSRPRPLPPLLGEFHNRLQDVCLWRCPSVLLCALQACLAEHLWVLSNPSVPASP